MYASASSRESVSPTSAMWWLHGTHGMPPDTPVVPPIIAAFSRTRTSAPPSAASVAAVSPAAPVPRTTTSTTRSQAGSGVAGEVDGVLMLTVTSEGWATRIQAEITAGVHGRDAPARGRQPVERA